MTIRVNVENIDDIIVFPEQLINSQMLEKDKVMQDCEFKIFTQQIKKLGSYFQLKLDLYYKYSLNSQENEWNVSFLSSLFT